ncbi:MAG: IscS subfamily cysteine desulfurase, partial [Planctomycetota bacterium]
IQLNGPLLDAGHRLSGNLNVCFPGVEGETLMMALPALAVSSGSACSSVDPRPSHVLMEILGDETAARCSLRFGIGHGNTMEEIETAADWIIATYRQYRGES